MHQGKSAREGKDKPEKLVKIFANYIYNNELICIIYKPLQQQTSSQKSPVKNGLGI